VKKYRKTKQKHRRILVKLRMAVVRPYQLRGLNVPEADAVSMITILIFK
jgi:hypothetical protein